MKGKHLRVSEPSPKIIALRFDASFFFEKAVRSLDRNHYDKALKYFRKAVEYEPDNPVNHCNMAGILSEMGDYAGSNEILSFVLSDVDSSMTECYFYMANNYANMEQFEEAEKALVTYLEEDEEGQFLDEAEEMMELLYYELDRPTKLNRIKARQGVVEHDQARVLLEEGKFAQAAQLLKQISEEQPDMFAARNNLALAYYYMGLFQNAKVTIIQVLEDEPGNLHALCNLAIFYQHEGGGPELDRLVQTLAVTIPFQEEQVFKLATTMGILGRHEEAYRHFRRLLHSNGENNADASLYHYTAVAASNTGRYAEARRLWSHLQKQDASSEVPRFFLSRLEELQQEGTPLQVLSYHYHLPFEEQFRMWEKFGAEQVPDSMKKDPLIRSSFFWALRHGDRATQLQVIQALSLIGDDEVRQALESFVEDPDQEGELKRRALQVLQELAEQDVQHTHTETEHPERLEAEQDPHTTEGDISASPVDPQWQAVLDKVLTVMSKSSDPAMQHDLRSLWQEYLDRLAPEVPMVQHTEGWAAALEYLTAKMHHHSVTYQEVADRYGISVSTVSRYARQIDSVCGIKQKLKQPLSTFKKQV
ncbi:tetratricopeptide (TPR) repeat protein [Paenibacillus jamilae]|jgi:tetratricopeptide (TPR) repeat protein|uniref:tetratricopeptide repeat protein n=1 Tax=Paenibacillus polymyxa TaxID=1406 RepID=UPI00129B9F66|nr:tetratricopeptide repeat protein [Paenibacillus polymyxa]MDP9678605.1 tetratricopeptide (TPR) repeat protein [Paenibacillus jamilae]KAE8560915.1 DDE transposase family protein [Paenibacillus polymyxa]MBY0023057.1 tetratricopeptide repeat protein [Paenibacillus polymyxa]MBY0059711.1 tetratricopeptide repeat protein [Paenibacillus polymyxa]MBY0069207.1 tetratricopeptide repeat protein [Paenibacillus polymyxa]